MTDIDLVSQTEETKLAAKLESILFVASEPVSVKRLATALDASAKLTERLLTILQQDFVSRGVRLQLSGSMIQLTTAPENSAVVERFLGLEFSSRLSQAALEVLAIVAFMQPATRPQIDQIRGVNSDSSLRTLLNQGLIEETGRMDSPGRPILYGTTLDFLQHFGLESLDELPPLPDEEEE